MATIIEPIFEEEGLEESQLKARDIKGGTPSNTEIIPLVDMDRYMFQQHGHQGEAQWEISTPHVRPVPDKVEKLFVDEDATDVQKQAFYKHKKYLEATYFTHPNQMPTSLSIKPGEIGNYDADVDEGYDVLESAQKLASPAFRKVLESRAKMLDEWENSGNPWSKRVSSFLRQNSRSPLSAKTMGMAANFIDNVAGNSSPEEATYLLEGLQDKIIYHGTGLAIEIAAFETGLRALKAFTYLPKIGGAFQKLAPVVPRKFLFTRASKIAAKLPPNEAKTIIEAAQGIGRYTDLMKHLAIAPAFAGVVTAFDKNADLMDWMVMSGHFLMWDGALMGIYHIGGGLKDLTFWSARKGYNAAMKPVVKFQETKEAKKFVSEAEALMNKPAFKEAGEAEQKQMLSQHLLNFREGQSKILSKKAWDEAKTENLDPLLVDVLQDYRARPGATAPSVPKPAPRVLDQVPREEKLVKAMNEKGAAPKKEIQQAAERVMPETAPSDRVKIADEIQEVATTGKVTKEQITKIIEKHRPDPESPFSVEQALAVVESIPSNAGSKKALERAEQILEKLTKGKSLSKDETTFMKNVVARLPKETKLATVKFDAKDVTEVAKGKKKRVKVDAPARGGLARDTHINDIKPKRSVPDTDVAEYQRKWLDLRVQGFGAEFLNAQANHPKLTPLEWIRRMHKSEFGAGAQVATSPALEREEKAILNKLAKSGLSKKDQSTLNKVNHEIKQKETQIKKLTSTIKSVKTPAAKANAKEKSAELKRLVKNLKKKKGRLEAKKGVTLEVAPGKEVSDTLKPRDVGRAALPKTFDMTPQVEELKTLWALDSSASLRKAVYKRWRELEPTGIPLKYDTQGVNSPNPDVASGMQWFIDNALQYKLTKDKSKVDMEIISKMVKANRYAQGREKPLDLTKNVLKETSKQAEANLTEKAISETSLADMTFLPTQVGPRERFIKKVLADLGDDIADKSVEDVKFLIPLKPPSGIPEDAWMEFWAGVSDDTLKALIPKVVSRTPREAAKSRLKARLAKEAVPDPVGSHEKGIDKLLDATVESKAEPEHRFNPVWMKKVDQERGTTSEVFEKALDPQGRSKSLGLGKGLDPVIPALPSGVAPGERTLANINPGKTEAGRIIQGGKELPRNAKLAEVTEYVTQDVRGREGGFKLVPMTKGRWKLELNEELYFGTGVDYGVNALEELTKMPGLRHFGVYKTLEDGQKALRDILSGQKIIKGFSDDPSLLVPAIRRELGRPLFTPEGQGHISKMLKLMGEKINKKLLPKGTKAEEGAVKFGKAGEPNISDHYINHPGAKDSFRRDSQDFLPTIQRINTFTEALRSAFVVEGNIKAIDGGMAYILREFRETQRLLGQSSLEEMTDIFGPILLNPEWTHAGIKKATSLAEEAILLIALHSRIRKWNKIDGINIKNIFESRIPKALGTPEALHDITARVLADVKKEPLIEEAVHNYFRFMRAIRKDMQAHATIGTSTNEFGFDFYTIFNTIHDEVSHIVKAKHGGLGLVDRFLASTAAQKVRQGDLGPKAKKLLTQVESNPPGALGLNPIQGAGRSLKEDPYFANIYKAKGSTSSLEANVLENTYRYLVGWKIYKAQHRLMADTIIRGQRIGTVLTKADLDARNIQNPRDFGFEPYDLQRVKKFLIIKEGDKKSFPLKLGDTVWMHPTLKKRIEFFRETGGISIASLITKPTAFWKLTTLMSAGMTYQMNNLMSDINVLYMHDATALSKLWESTMTMVFKSGRGDAAALAQHLGISGSGFMSEFTEAMSHIPEWKALQTPTQKYQRYAFGKFSDAFFRMSQKREGIARFAKFLKDIERLDRAVPLRQGENIIGKEIPRGQYMFRKVNNDQLKTIMEVSIEHSVDPIQEIGRRSRDIFVDYPNKTGFMKAMSNSVFPFLTWPAGMIKTFKDYFFAKPGAMTPQVTTSRFYKNMLAFLMKQEIPAILADQNNYSVYGGQVESAMPRWFRDSPHFIVPGMGVNLDSGKTEWFIGPQHIGELAHMKFPWETHLPVIFHARTPLSEIRNILGLPNLHRVIPDMIRNKQTISDVIDKWEPMNEMSRNAFRLLGPALAGFFITFADLDLANQRSIAPDPLLGDEDRPSENQRSVFGVDFGEPVTDKTRAFWRSVFPIYDSMTGPSLSHYVNVDQEGWTSQVKERWGKIGVGGALNLRYGVNQMLRGAGVTEEPEYFKRNWATKFLSDPLIYAMPTGLKTGEFQGVVDVKKQGSQMLESLITKSQDKPLIATTALSVFFDNRDFTRDGINAKYEKFESERLPQFAASVQGQMKEALRQAWETDLMLLRANDQNYRVAHRDLKNAMRERWDRKVLNGLTPEDRQRFKLIKKYY